MKEWWYITLLIRNLSTRWGWVVGFTPRGKHHPQYLWIGGWMWAIAGLDTLEKRQISCLRGNSTMISRTYSLVSCTSTKLYCLYNHQMGNTWWRLGWGTALQAGRLRFWFPNGIIGIFHWLNPCDCTMFLGSTRLPTKMNTRDMFHGGKGSWCTGLTNWLPPCADCLEILGACMSWHPKACVGMAFNHQMKVLRLYIDLHITWECYVHAPVLKYYLYGC
jgi:hypothetical protein